MNTAFAPLEASSGPAPQVTAWFSIDSAKLSASIGMWALELRESGEFIGRAGLYGPTGWPGVEAARSIRRDLWGQGLAVEAGQAAVHFARQHLRVNHLVSIIEPDHQASRRVAEKLHFRFVELADVGPWKEQANYRLDLPEQT